jgi:hypothetical protein
MFNDVVYKEVKLQLNEELDIDVNDDELKTIIDFATEESKYEFLLTRDGLEYWNPCYLDFFQIHNGKWNDKDVYFYFDAFINFHSDVNDFYDGSLKKYLNEAILDE